MDGLLFCQLVLIGLCTMFVTVHSQEVKDPDVKQYYFEGNDASIYWTYIPGTGTLNAIKWFKGLVGDTLLMTSYDGSTAVIETAYQGKVDFVGIGNATVNPAGLKIISMQGVDAGQYSVEISYGTTKDDNTATIKLASVGDIIDGTYITINDGNEIHPNDIIGPVTSGNVRITMVALATHGTTRFDCVHITDTRTPCPVSLSGQQFTVAASGGDRIDLLVTYLEVDSATYSFNISVTGTSKGCTETGCITYVCVSDVFGPIEVLVCIVVLLVKYHGQARDEEGSAINIPKTLSNKLVLFIPGAVGVVIVVVCPIVVSLIWCKGKDCIGIYVAGGIISAAIIVAVLVVYFVCFEKRPNDNESKNADRKADSGNEHGSVTFHNVDYGTAPIEQANSTRQSQDSTTMLENSNYTSVDRNRYQDQKL